MKEEEPLYELLQDFNTPDISISKGTCKSVEEWIRVIGILIPTSHWRDGARSMKQEVNRQVDP